MNTHVGLFAAEPEVLVRFYTEKMNFVEAGRRVIPQSMMQPIFGLEVDCEMIKLRLDDTTLEIFAPLENRLERKREGIAGYNHWGITVADKEDYCLRLERSGVTIIKAEKDGRQIYFIKDPEGNLIEVFDS